MQGGKAAGKNQTPFRTERRCQRFATNGAQQAAPLRSPLPPVSHLLPCFPPHPTDAN